MASFLEFCKTIGPARLAAMGAVAVGLVGFFIFLILRISQPQMTVLYAEMPIEDSNAVVQKLEGMNIPFELRNEGATILVPKARVLRLRMSLAEEGLPAGGVVGYEIFDKGDTLGATSFVQNLNHLRALEGELARTIRALDRVQLARVHLVLPERQLFSKEKSEPTASIVMKVRGGLGRGQIQAIQHLVASAVKDLKPTRVSIVDERGELLASGADDGDHATLIGSLEERNLATERRMKSQIDDIITSIVGPNNARVQVTAEVDYNRITQTSDTFDPNSQVIRSTQTREETSNSRGAAGGGGVSVGNELPRAGGTGTGAGGTGNAEAANKTEEVVNYEISKTTKTEVIAAGRIKKVSVAVLVDGTYVEGADGKPAYTPRPQEQLDQIATLVRSAIGFDQARGDQVEIINMQFAPTATPAPLEDGNKAWYDLGKDDYFYVAELATLLIVAVLVLLLVVRPLIRRIVTPEDNGAIDIASLAISSDSRGQGEITGPDGETIMIGSHPRPALTAGESKASTLIDFAQVAGEVHGKTVKKVAELVRTNPEEAVAIIRQWMSQEEAA